nr:hypothetical protein [Tanacetum cinerariifolium]
MADLSVRLSVSWRGRLRLRFLQLGGATYKVALGQIDPYLGGAVRYRTLGQIDPYLGRAVRHHACSHGEPHTLFSCPALANLSSRCQWDLNVGDTTIRGCDDHGGLKFPFVYFCTRKSKPNDWELKIRAALMCFRLLVSYWPLSYGSSLLILSAYASSMPAVLSLPLYMACDDSDGCVTMMIGSVYDGNDDRKWAIAWLGYLCPGNHNEPSFIIPWENTKRADIEAKLRRDMTKIKQNTLKNKAGLIHKQAEEKRAMVVPKKSEDNLKADARLAPQNLHVVHDNQESCQSAFDDSLEPVAYVKENPKKDKIESKPDKNGKRGEAEKS